MQLNCLAVSRGPICVQAHTPTETRSQMDVIVIALQQIGKLMENAVSVCVFVCVSVCSLFRVSCTTSQTLHKPLRSEGTDGLMNQSPIVVP